VACQQYSTIHVASDIWVSSLVFRCKHQNFTKSTLNNICQFWQHFAKTILHHPDHSLSNFIWHNARSYMPPIKRMFRLNMQMTATVSRWYKWWKKH